MFLIALLFGYSIIAYLLHRRYHGVKKIIVLLWLFWFSALGLLSPSYCFLFDVENRALRYELGDLQSHKQSLGIIFLCVIMFFCGVWLVSTKQRKLPKIRLGNSILIFLSMLLFLKFVFVYKGYYGSMTGLLGTGQFTNVSRFFIFIPGLILAYFHPKKLKVIFAVVAVAILIDLIAGDRRSLVKYELLIFTVCYSVGVKFKKRQIMPLIYTTLVVGVLATYHGFYLDGRAVDLSSVTFVEAVRVVPDSFFSWASQYFIISGAMDLNLSTGTWSSLLGPFLFLIDGGHSMRLNQIEEILFFYTSNFNIQKSILTLPMQASAYSEQGIYGVLLVGFVKGLFFGYILSFVRKGEIIFSGLLAYNSIHISQDLLVSSRGFLILILFSFGLLVTRKYRLW